MVNHKTFGYRHVKKVGYEYIVDLLIHEMVHLMMLSKRRKQFPELYSILNFLLENYKFHVEKGPGRNVRSFKSIN